MLFMLRSINMAHSLLTCSADTDTREDMGRLIMLLMGSTRIKRMDRRLVGFLTLKSKLKVEPRSKPFWLHMHM